MKDSIERDLSLTFARKGRGCLGQYAYMDSGAALFSRFQLHRDYTPFHEEQKLFTENADAIASEIQDTNHLVIVGQGPWQSIQAKELKLIDRLGTLEKLDLIDISDIYNQDATSRLNAHFRNAGRKVEVQSHKADFVSEEALAAIRSDDLQSTVICTGATFTNPVNASLEGFSALKLSTSLNALAQMAGPGGNVIITYDGNGDRLVLGRAYNSGTLEEFYLDGLRNALRECKSIQGLDPDDVQDIFEMTQRWYPDLQEYAHKLRIKENADPIHITIKNEWIDIDNLPLHPLEEFTMMSCIKPDSRLISELGNSRGMTTRFKISGQHENTIHVFKNDYVESPAPSAS